MYHDENNLIFRTARFVRMSHHIHYQATQNTSGILEAEHLSYKINLQCIRLRTSLISGRDSWWTLKMTATRKPLGTCTESSKTNTSAAKSILNISGWGYPWFSGRHSLSKRYILVTRKSLGRLMASSKPNTSATKVAYNISGLGRPLFSGRRGLWELRMADTTKPHVIFVVKHLSYRINVYYIRLRTFSGRHGY